METSLLHLSLLKTVHIIGAFLLFYAFGALAYGASHNIERNFADKRHYVMLHGLGLFFLLLTGLGQMHILRTGFPGWVMVKFVVWLLLGGSMTLLLRKPEWTKWSWILLLALGATAVMAALTHAPSA